MLNATEAPARVIALRFAPQPDSDSAPEPQKLSLTARIAALPWRANKRGEKTMLSLSEAATAAGDCQIHHLASHQGRSDFCRPNTPWNV
jgi:hypothetical protein